MHFQKKKKKEEPTNHSSMNEQIYSSFELNSYILYLVMQGNGWLSLYLLDSNPSCKIHPPTQRYIPNHEN